ncbi:Tah1 protein [Maudiozyma humilis]|uniref:Tah1 protein n=1 Tax=Maudiozyma humilis TaxID=51915 RepID=A0AAV5RSJ1_MAUHU|nr:Tah1 protein [Kazachstania humilis]
MSLFDSFKERGNTFFKAGKYKDAIGCYDHCIKIQPSEIAPYTNKALCQIKSGDYEGAIVSCNEAKNHVQPGNPEHKRLSMKLTHHLTVASEALGITQEASDDLLPPKKESEEGTSEITIVEVDTLPAEFRRI